MRGSTAFVAVCCSMACQGTPEVGTGQPGESYTHVVEAKEASGWLQSPTFVAGAGDPEDFLYRGRRLADGTRDGDQLSLIEDLASQNVNGLYVQMVRSHGGGGPSDHNPFAQNDPDQGLNSDLLDQWETWFERMEAAGIAILLFFYDDGTRVWPTGDSVGPQEEEFIRSIVNRFERFPNIVWAVAEEYPEAYSDRRVANIASQVAMHDDSSRSIAVHKLAGTRFGEFARDAYVNVIAMQLGDMPAEQLNFAVTRAWSSAMQLYSVIMSEIPQWSTGIDAQHRAWASAFGGAHVMVSDLALDDQRRYDLTYLSHLREFSESFNLVDAVPYSRVADRQSLFAMRDDAGSYFLYGMGEVGISGIVPGTYAYTAFDPATGRTDTETVTIESYEWRRQTGDDYPNGVAIALRPAGSEVGDTGSFPGPAWEVGATNVDSERNTALEAVASSEFAAGCIIRNGRMQFSWGDLHTRREWASAAKPLLGMLIGHAIERGEVHSIDQRVVDYGWPLIGSSREVTLRQLVNMTSGYAREEVPGAAWAYNDLGPAMLGQTLERAFGREIDEVFRDWLAPLDFQDSPGLESRRGHGLVSSVRDACRLGLFYLNEGEWGPHQLLPSRIFRSLAAPAVPGDLERSEGSSYNYLLVRSFGGGTNQTEYGPGIYGSGFWFNEIVPQTGRRLFPDLPKGTYHADGHFTDKHITVIPSMALVIVGHTSGRDAQFEPGREDWWLNRYLAEITQVIDGRSS